MPLVAVLCMVISGCTVAKSPPENIPNVVTKDIQAGIEKHIDEQTELGDGYFKIEFEDDETRKKWLDNLTENLNLNFDLYSMMTWDDIRSCIQNGFSIGSHSYSHRNLSQVKEPELLETEISFSRQKILQETGIAPSVFTFPNGQYNDSLLKMVEESGYSIALLHGLNQVDLINNEKPANLNIINDSDGLLCLPRIDAEENWRETVLRSSGFHYQMKRIINFRRRRDLDGRALRG